MREASRCCGGTMRSGDALSEPRLSGRRRCATDAAQDGIGSAEPALVEVGNRGEGKSGAMSKPIDRAGTFKACCRVHGMEGDPRRARRLRARARCRRRGECLRSRRPPIERWRWASDTHARPARRSPAPPQQAFLTRPRIEEQARRCSTTASATRSSAATSAFDVAQHLQVSRLGGEMMR